MNHVFLLVASAFQSHFKDEKLKYSAKEGGRDKGMDGKEAYVGANNWEI